MKDKELDSEGRSATFIEGERVYVLPLKLQATVIRQILHWDYSESFWGNVELMYDDGVKGTSNCWQLEKL
ncbi:MAG: hypothetical protein EBZ49_16035 [Proteobacteria bacterium]|nr:hypothetical protein [Pseudomonadota bacterium]